jgi:tRNA-2-methylthio-N6-dimethylallyladenosine synthase
MNRRFYIKAYGCQMNFYEAGVVNSILEKASFSPVVDENQAEIILLLTCSVRNHAETRALGRLASLKQKNNGNRIVGILGCMAQNHQAILANRYGADLVVGPDGYRLLPELLNMVMEKKSPQICTTLNEECYDGILPKPNGKVTGLVSIMRGCNNFCSYCIVPYVRGRERSRDYQDIIKEIEVLSQGGIKDITLVGQNVLAYNNNDSDFCELMRRVDQMANIKRIRFITAHPKDFNEPVIETLAGLKKFCPGIHLPLQSGSKRILRLMNRGYTPVEYLEKIEMARQRIKNVSFTTDILVGFPTETEEDFNATLDLVQRIRFDFAYMFQYSPRPHTKALTIKPEVDKQTAHQRLDKLIAIQNQITKENNQALIGEEFEVMIESLKYGGALPQAVTRTKTNKVVIIDKILPIGEIMKVKIIDIRGWTPIGEVIADLDKEES